MIHAYFLIIMHGITKRVAVAMSGGIDSAVAAMLLKDKGYDCIGVFMRNWDKADDESEQCTIEEDRIHMRQICNRLGIPDYEVSFVKEYWSKVFTPFINTCQGGIATPNPDVYCNRLVKFQDFQNHIREKFGIEYFATGHYARLVNSPFEQLHGSNQAMKATTMTPRLLRGIDEIKDQSYFLALTQVFCDEISLSQWKICFIGIMMLLCNYVIPQGENLKNVLFPLGNYHKSEIREMAKSRFSDLKVLTKRESTGICFIGKRCFPDFMQQYITFTPGRYDSI